MEARLVMPVWLLVIAGGVAVWFFFFRHRSA